MPGGITGSSRALGALGRQLTEDDTSGDVGEGRGVIVLAGAFSESEGPPDMQGSESASGIVGLAPLELHAALADGAHVDSLLQSHLDDVVMWAFVAVRSALQRSGSG